MSKAICDENVTGRLLAAHRAMRGTEWDSRDLDHFVQVPSRLDAERHGFGALDVLTTEDARVGRTGEDLNGGLVAPLLDARRAHVDCRAGQSDGQPQWAEGDPGIVAGLPGSSEQHPGVAAREGWQHDAWDEVTAPRLNDLLGRITR